MGPPIIALGAHRPRPARQVSHRLAYSTLNATTPRPGGFAGHPPIRQTVSIVRRGGSVGVGDDPATRQPLEAASWSPGRGL